MAALKLYEINDYYVKYLSQYQPGIFLDSKKKNAYKRKYVGVVLTVNEMNYFVPLSSFKEKHRRMKDRMDFIKIKDYAVLNLNKMIPVPLDQCEFVDINKIKDKSYRYILLSEYRYIKSIHKKIAKNAENLYKHKIENGNLTPLAKRCNDFMLLEKLCELYSQG